MSMDVSSRDEREEERARQRRVAEELKASGALEGIFAQVDAGAPLTGSDGVLAGVVKAALERGGWLLSSLSTWVMTGGVPLCGVSSGGG